MNNKPKHEPTPGFPGSKEFIPAWQIEQDPEKMKEVKDLENRFFTLVSEFIDRRFVPFFISSLEYILSSHSFDHYVEDITLNSGQRLRFFNLPIDCIPKDGEDDE